MFGGFRLVLATIVAVFHAGYAPGGYWIGISAVIGFYILSGYAITALLLSRFTQPASYLTFYWERLVRLAPQYYLWITIAAILTSVFHLSMSSAPWRPLDAQSLTMYTLLAPLAFITYFPTLSFTPLITHAVSLAIEVTFYALAPWIFIRRIPGYIAACVSLGIFLATALGSLPPFVYTYLATPGPLIFVMLGNFIYRRDWSALIISTVALTATLLPLQKFDAELLIGVAICLPAVLFFGRFRSGRLDQALGNASYGCFLCHKCSLHIATDDAVLRRPVHYLCACGVARRPCRLPVVPSRRVSDP